VGTVQQFSFTAGGAHELDGDILEQRRAVGFLGKQKLAAKV